MSAHRISRRAAALTALGVSGLFAAVASGGDAFSQWTRGRLRGFTTDNLPHFSVATLQALAATGGNLARVGFDFADCTDDRLPAPLADRLLTLLDAAQRAGVALVLVGSGDVSGRQPLWHDATLQDRFVATWRSIAQAVRNHPALVGLDLLNEPHPPMPDGRPGAAQTQWMALASRCIGAIRSAECTTPIVLEGVAGGSVLGLAGLVPLPLRGIVYSIHFYTPHEITHQGVSPQWPRRIPYPADASHGLGAWDASLGVGPIDARRLRAELRPAREFQQRHGVPLYVGEFGCVRWAPDGSALRWVGDCLDLFEEEGWHWTFHSFRTWPGWDAEVAADEPPASRHRAARTPLMQRLQRALLART
jgi:endoglucanase